MVTYRITNIYGAVKHVTTDCWLNIYNLTGWSHSEIASMEVVHE